jgi:hypothetical protein
VLKLRPKQYEYKKVKPAQSNLGGFFVVQKKEVGD